MKNNIVLGISLLTAGVFSAQAQVQQQGFLENTAIEIGWGYNTPMSPTTGIKAADFSGFTSFYVGAHYELDDWWGIRGTYAYNEFVDKNNSELGLEFHKLMLESTFNVSRAVSGVSAQAPLEVLAHMGLGLSFGTSKLKSGSDAMGSIQFGLMPRYAITDKISVHLDATYVANFSQDYGYHGGPALDTGKSTTGGYLTTNLGVALKL